MSPADCLAIWLAANPLDCIASVIRMVRLVGVDCYVTELEAAVDSPIMAMTTAAVRELARRPQVMELIEDLAAAKAEGESEFQTTLARASTAN